MSAPGGETLAQKIRFASYYRPWMIVLRGRRALAFDLWLVDRTGFSLMSLQYALAGGNRYTPTLALTAIGARSGALRRVALPYLRHGEDYLVIGSNAGGPTDPVWVGNLRAEARCWLRVKRRDIVASARIAAGEERERLFAEVVRRKPNVARYQQRASGFGREIPIVVLSPLP